VKDLLETFLTEARELVQQASDDLLSLERNPADAARLDSAFRAVHTLKGSVAIFDFAPMTAALHAGEDLLEVLRAGQLTLGRTTTDALLALINTTDSWVESIAATGALPDDAPLRGTTLQAALRAEQRGAGSAPSPVPGPAPDWLPALQTREAEVIARAHAAGQAVTALRYLPAPDCFFLGDDPMALIRAVPQLAALHLGLREPWPAEGPDPFSCNLVVEAVSTAPAAEIRPIFRFVADQVALAEIPPPIAPEPMPAAAAALPAAPRSLRVDAARIDALVDLAGELVVAKNSLAHLVARAGDVDPALARALAESQAGIERLAEAMHRQALGLRLVPLGRSFARFPRLLRDTAGRLGKEVEFTVQGEAVEADKSIVDGLFEPLLHLLRNSIDHGIEAPAARIAAGKARKGRVALTARQAEGGVVVELSDDGRGIDPARLRQVARERRLMEPAAIDALDDAAALNLIFRAGFSTAKAVSDISGRGVGMDAVRAAVEGMGGRITLSSTPGTGTTIRLSLPQGAAVTTVLTVRAGSEAFGIPVEMVAETTRVPADRILPLGGAEAFVLRGRTVPLLRLAALLGLPTAPRGETARVLVTGSGSGRVGLEVEGFTGRLDVLLRPLDGLLRGLPALLGTALLGDGRVLMVLDLSALIEEG
jgi:two-component system chemotaxis sensor kinase CheA